MAAPKGDSRVQLLDAAEELFAKKGYDAASIRQIAALSGNTIGTMSYHFGSKETLLSEVINRRFMEIAEVRRKMYNDFKAESADGVLTLEQVITAIVKPFLQCAFCGKPGWRSYTMLLGRILYTGNQDIYNKLMEITTPVTLEAFGWFKQIVPDDTPPKDLATAYQFLISNMMDCCSPIEQNLIDSISGIKTTTTTVDDIWPRLERCLFAGARAILQLPA